MSQNKRAVHVATIKRHHNGKTYVTHLLRRTFREGGKVKHVTVANLSALPDDLIAVIRRRLAGDPLPADAHGFHVVRSLPHGHVAAVLGTLKKIGLDRLLSSKPCREAELVVAMIALRIISPGSKLANLTGLRPETAEHSLGGELRLEDAEPADPATFTAQVGKIRKRFGIRRVVLVGDRGMITSKRIDADLRGIEGLDWITALRNDSIQKLVADQVIQPSLFDERDLAEVSSADYPGERLVVCRNPLLADERARKRQELLAAAEKKLEAIAQAVSRKRRPLRGKEQIGLRVGRELKNTKMQKHFALAIEDDSFTYRRRDEKIAAEAALDGLYVVRTSVKAETLSAERAVAAYKDLSQVEWAFRSLKSVDLKVRPIYHWKDDRIRAHVFLCMLAYYVEWHMRGKLAELLFDDHQRELAEQTRESIVSKAPRSEAAKLKERNRRTQDGLPVQSFQCLLKDLATLCKNRVCWKSSPEAQFHQLTIPTELQRRAFDLLGLAVGT